MKLKDLLSEGRFDMEGPESAGGPCPGCDDGDCECKAGAGAGGDESCPGCGRMPGDGYGTDCEDPMGCGYWKDWAREAVAELRHDMQKERGSVDEATFFDRYMQETLQLEERKARQNKAPLIAESIGKVRQKRVQELPHNRIRIGVK